MEPRDEILSEDISAVTVAAAQERSGCGVKWIEQMVSCPFFIFQLELTGKRSSNLSVIVSLPFFSVDAPPQ